MPSVPPRDDDGSVVVAARLVDPPDQPWPYGDERGHRSATTPSHDTVEVTLTPYHSWANRGPSTMRVWIPATNT